MVSSLMLIVVERRETFHYYYPMGVHPPGDLTVTMCVTRLSNTFSYHVNDDTNQQSDARTYRHSKRDVFECCSNCNARTTSD